MAGFKHAALSPRRRLAISALAAAIVVFVVVGIALELTFLPKASSPGNVTTSAGCQATGSAAGSPPSTPVKSSANLLVKDFNSRDVSGMSNFYAQDSCVKWVGAPGLEGVYLGQGNVRILYGSSIGKTIWLNASVTNYAEKAASPSDVNVTMTIDMRGNSTVVGGLNATIDATQQWNYNGGQWQIQKENWNYVTFKVQNPVPSTTFPQWTALKNGHNPDLISEKSFEWHAGPYLAALVYAFLGESSQSESCRTGEGPRPSNRMGGSGLPRTCVLGGRGLNLPTQEKRVGFGCASQKAGEPLQDVSASILLPISFHLGSDSHSSKPGLQR